MSLREDLRFFDPDFASRLDQYDRTVREAKIWIAVSAACWIFGLASIVLHFAGIWK